MNGPNRRGDWKQTFSGVAFWPLDPRPEEIRIVDIAHALACTNRYGGHAPYPYSVAQHSVLVLHRARELGLGLVTPEEDLNVARWALLHDAAEAYIGDMVRPLKRTPEMAPFREAEARIVQAVAQRFGLVGDEPWQVKQADLDLLTTEAAVFFPEAGRPLPWGRMGVRLDLPMAQIDWTQAKAAFLDHFHALWPAEPR